MVSSSPLSMYGISLRQLRNNLMFSTIVNELPPCISDRLFWTTNIYDDSLPYPFSPSADLGQLHELRRDLSAVFHDMRHLTLAIESDGLQHSKKSVSYPRADLLDFNTMRNALEYRLLTLKYDNVATDMTLADFSLEISRLAALIYLQYTVPRKTPDKQRVQSLRMQVLEHLRGLEETYSVEAEDFHLGVLLWAQFIAAKIPWDDGVGAEEIWMRQRIARSVRAAGIVSWAEMERRLRCVCWMELLHTADCKRSWLSVERINKSYWTENVLLV